jgi:hypothetical protein
LNPKATIPARRTETEMTYHRRYLRRWMSRRKRELIKLHVSHGWQLVPCDCHRRYVHRHLKHPDYASWMIVS